MKSWSSFFWGVLFGTCAVHQTGCASSDVGVGKLFQRLCHFPASEAFIEVHDPDGVYPALAGSRVFNRASTTSCEQTASFGGGTRLTFSCEDSDPVDYCEARGECVDSESGAVFLCEGSVEFL